MITVQTLPGKKDQYSNDNEMERSSRRDERSFPGSVSTGEDDTTEDELVADTENPILTENDLVENDLAGEEEDIDWDEPQR